MKILSIRGKNLASLEDEFEINFTEPPLNSAGIFAITGNTGAGKSTILDAMCLALFDNAPRFNKAEKIKSENLEEDMLSPQDTKNILRRGTAEGFAEVNFVALNGNIYSARWIVRRARGKSDGTFQPTVIRLNNISDKIEEQGTKTDLLKKITELIGLTFEQFTRAVLLAQGDFATFLKAKQNEKAELLEKLTGTEIYSKISANIYKKTKDAENSLELIKRRINDIKLLTDDEVEVLNTQKQTFEQELEPIKDTYTQIEKNLNWIKEESQYNSDIEQTQTNLHATQSAIKEAAPRHEYLEKVEHSQEIRDSYISFLNKQNQIKTTNENLMRYESELKSTSAQMVVINKNLAEAKKLSEENENEYLSVKPEIIKAGELDIKITAGKENKETAGKELSNQLKQREQIHLNISNFKKKLNYIYDITIKLGEWFIEHDSFKNIIPKTDLIISLLNDAGIASGQRIKVTESLESEYKLHNTNKQQLIQLENELESLNNLLPSEIFILREKLKDGDPCPVCGSIHHPGKESIQNSQKNEQELEQSKKEVNIKISNIKEKIEYSQKRITQSETLISNYLLQYENAISKAGEYLKDLPVWHEQADINNFIKSLLELTNQWNKNKAILDNAYKDIEIITTKLETENLLLSKNESELKQKKDIYDTLESGLNRLIDDRASVLGGKKTEDVEIYYNRLQKKYNSSYEELRVQKETINSKIAKTEGIIVQIKADVSILSEQIKILHNNISDWLNNNKDFITEDDLKSIFSKSHEWLSNEKAYLSGLMKEELSLTATLNERRSRLETHMKSEYRPLKEQNKETLNILLNETVLREKQIRQQLTEINLAFIKHNEGKEKLKTVNNELSKKSELCESWQKLNILLGSADGAKFKTIAQGYTLDILLGYANKHLYELSKRYKLEKIPDTLALQVVDNDMLGEVRTVHSLSGGESFLISLALALGLSSLSSNRMKIESLFIDEGFGALDVNTLSMAMDVLENLQTQGRKIGVISHVTEMTERIMTQIQVIKLSNGRSAIKVVG